MSLSPARALPTKAKLKKLTVSAGDRMCLTMHVDIDQLELMKVVNCSSLHSDPALRYRVIEVLVQQARKQPLLSIAIRPLIEARDLRCRNSERSDELSHRRSIGPHQRVCESRKDRVRITFFTERSEKLQTILVAGVSKSVISSETVEDCDNMISQPDVSYIPPLAFHRPALLLDLCLYSKPCRGSSQQRDQSAHEISGKTQPFARCGRPRSSPDRPCNTYPGDKSPYQKKTNCAGQPSISFKIHPSTRPAAHDAVDGSALPPAVQSPPIALHRGFALTGKDGSAAS